VYFADPDGLKLECALRVLDRSNYRKKKFGPKSRPAFMRKFQPSTLVQEYLISARGPAPGERNRTISIDALGPLTSV
jgi:hypothetical protein